MSKRPSDEKLRQKMNGYAADLLDATYGHIRTSLEAREEEGGLIKKLDPDNLPKPDVFNAVVNWLRTESGMEPATQEKSGIAELTEQLDNRKR